MDLFRDPLAAVSDAAPTAMPSSRLRRIAPGLLAAALGIVVFSGSLGHGFAYDDAFILRSPLLSDPWNLRAVFAGEFYAPSERYLGLYRPLGQWSLVLNAVLAKALFGAFDRPAAFHAVSLLLHAAASFLVFVWLVRLPFSRFVAGAAAVLWAVHPVHAEVAVNVTARYESLAAVFGLGFLIAHRSGRGIAGALLFLAALFCKESAVVFLPLALAAGAIFPKDGRRFELGGSLPSILVLAVWFVLRRIALAGTQAATPFVENPLTALTLLERAPTAAKVQLLYLRDQLLPLRLSTDHSYAQIDLERGFLGKAPLAFLAIVAAAGLAAWLLGKRRPALAFVVLGYAIAFSLGSNFLVPIGTIMADRLAYLPSVFTCVLAAMLFAGRSTAGVPRLRAARVALVALAAGALSFASVGQVPQWKDDLALFERQVITAPKSAKSHGNLGNALREKGRLDEAIAEYRKSIEIWPYRPEPHLGLARAYEAQRADPELLINTWADAVRYGTRGDEPLLQEALSCVDLGRWEELERTRQRMIAANPNDPFLVHVGRLLRAGERLVAEPRTTADWMNGRVLMNQRDFAGAAASYQKAVHRGGIPDQEMIPVLLALAQCHEELGRPRRAEHFRRLVAKATGKPH